MVVTFTKDGAESKFKLKQATLKNVSKVFGLEPESVFLIDNEGVSCFPEDGLFEDLEDGGTYIVSVDNERTTKMAGVAERSLAKNDQKALAFIRGQHGQNVIKEVMIESTKMHESSTLLHQAPEAVVLMQCLAVLSATSKDPSLVTKENPATKFVRLHHPTSFRACLNQVAFNMSDAFHEAHKSMCIIRASLRDIPDSILHSIDVLGKSADDETTKTRKWLNAKLDRAIGKSKAAIENAVKSFNGVRLDIAELSNSAILADTTINRSKEDKDQQLLRIQEEKAGIEQSQERLNKQYETTREEAIKTLKEHQAELRSSGGIGRVSKYVAATVVDTFASIVTLRPITEGLFGRERKSPTIMEQIKEAEEKKLNDLRQLRESSATKAEEQRKELEKNSQRIADMVAKLSELNTETASLDHVLTYLREASELLGQVSTSWQRLRDFFTKVEVSISEELCNMVNDITNEDAPEAMKLQCSLKATGACMMVANCAETYTLMSDRFIEPSVSLIATQLTMDRQSALEKQKEVKELLSATRDGVNKLVRDEMKKFEVRLEEQMIYYKSSFAKEICNEPTGTVTGPIIEEID